MYVCVRDQNFSPWTPCALKIELSFSEVPVLILPPLNNAGDQLWWVSSSGPSCGSGLGILSRRVCRQTARFCQRSTALSPALQRAESGFERASTSAAEHIQTAPEQRSQARTASTQSLKTKQKKKKNCFSQEIGSMPADVWEAM